MSRVFLDIGAHVGETLEVVKEPRWGFDRIYCFEPAPQCWDRLEALVDDRVRLFRFGLWSCDTSMPLHEPGEIGASVFGSKSSGAPADTVALRDVSVWFAEHLSDEDHVVAKINCEGAEIEIISRLLDTGQIRELDELLVHFDIRKVPGQEHREAEIRGRLDGSSVPYRAAESIFFGRNVQEKTRNWLSWYQAGPAKRPWYSVVRRVSYSARCGVAAVRGRPSTYPRRSG
jgi:FkbM family methyltransferase